MNYVADTHAILWHLFDPHRLGVAARAAFDDTEEGAASIFLPAVVVAEMIMVVQRQRLPGVALPQLLDQFAIMRSSVNYVLLPLLPDTVIASHALDQIPDIFDRLVVAQALQMNLPLITRDATITGSGVLVVVWH